MQRIVSMILIGLLLVVSIACGNPKIQQLDRYARDTWTQGLAWAETLQLTDEQKAELDVIKERIITMYHMAKEIFGDDSLLADILAQAIVELFKEQVK